MAIVKASYTRSREGAKASILYMIHRPGLDKKPMTRQLVGFDGVLEKLDALQMVDEAGEGTYFYRLVLNFDAKTEDTQKDLFVGGIIEKAMLHLEGRFQKELQFVAVEHDDHTPLRHTHMLALLPGKLNVSDLTALREAVTAAALSQRQELDLALAAVQQGRGVASVPERPNARTPQTQRQVYEPPSRGSVRPKPEYQVCHLCGKPSGKKAIRCYNCGVRLAISLDLGDNGLGNDWDL
jgi:hypothetical protein